MEKKEVKIKVKPENLTEILGVFDENLTLLMKETGVSVFVDENEFVIKGEKQKADIAEAALQKLINIAAIGEKIDKLRVLYCVELARGNVEETIDVKEAMGSVVAITEKGRRVKCKTIGQKKYVDAIKDKSVVFGVGPAGTGKTYLAVAMAAKAMKLKETEKIILTRPAVEAGEKLGFLPGDLQNKVDPYLRPLYDALAEMFGLETYQRLMERGAIEIAPLAYMRGRTLSDSFIILDEAQNTTVEQMKMFLTRMGENSKMVVTGDITQVDLPAGKESGLKNAVKVLDGVDGIEIVKLTHKDVVRHPLVAAIIKAYEKSENASRGDNSAEGDKGNHDDEGTENRKRRRG